MEGKTGRTKGKENTCRTVGITKALADSGHSTARKGFFYFFALKFGYSTETKNPNASPIRKVFGLFVCGRNDRIRTCDIVVPNHARYQLRYIPILFFYRLGGGVLSVFLSAQSLVWKKAPPGVQMSARTPRLLTVLADLYARAFARTVRCFSLFLG